MKRKIIYACLSLILLGIQACGNNDAVSKSLSSDSQHISDADKISGYASHNKDSTQSVLANDTPLSSDTDITKMEEDTRPNRDSTPVCLVPTADGVSVFDNSVASIDTSNSGEGYIGVSYFGSCSKVKLQIAKQNGTTYTYNLSTGKGYDFFPLSEGDGAYSINICENVQGNKYAVALSTDLDVKIDNIFGPYLYPNQYVNFNKDNKVIAKGAELAAQCKDDLEVVTSIYNYVSKNISYDYQKAETVQSGYLSDIDQILSIGTGICLDYSSVMASMLRSQRIPTRLEVGYVGTLYHAWISTYIKEIGWVNGIIQFDGTDWKIMDPTFASTVEPEELKSFLNDSNNYQTKYVY